MNAFHLGWLVLLGNAAFGCGQSDAGSPKSSTGRDSDVASAALTPSAPEANCAAFTVTGSPTSQSGASWTYVSTDAGVSYRLSGVVLAPSGSGPLPAIVLNHGTGGSPRQGDALAFLRTVRSWGAVAIAPFYTHATVDRVGGSAQGLSHLPNCSPLCPLPGTTCGSRCYGASPPNVMRAHKTRDLLSCLQGAIGVAVDLERVGTHGHSRGAQLTAEVAGAFPNDYRAASHTAGGVAQPTENPDRTTATNVAVAQAILAPYSIHHSPADDAVALVDDERLRDILVSNGVPNELHSDYLYGRPDESDEPPDNDHAGTGRDPSMFARVRSWYQLHGLLPTP